LGVFAALTVVFLVRNPSSTTIADERVIGCGPSVDSIEEVFRGDFGTTEDGTPINSDGMAVQPDGRCKLNDHPIKVVYRKVPRQEYLGVLIDRYYYIYSSDVGLTRAGRKYEFGIKQWGRNVPGVVVNDVAPTRADD
jgi:hypothetical protein